MPKAVEKPVMQSGAGSTYGRNAAPNAFSLGGLQIAIGAPLTKYSFCGLILAKATGETVFCAYLETPHYRAGRQRVSDWS